MGRHDNRTKVRAADRLPDAGCIILSQMFQDVLANFAAGTLAGLLRNLDRIVMFVLRSITVMPGTLPDPFTSGIAFIYFSRPADTSYRFCHHTPRAW